MEKSSEHTGRRHLEGFMDRDTLFEFLEEKHHLYNHPSFIQSDPIQVPHAFEEPGDIELASFLTAIIAWGQRPTIIKNAQKLMELMENSPFAFLSDSSEEEWERFLGFVHRTFNGIDCIYFLRSLQHMIRTHGSLRRPFVEAYRDTGDLSEGVRRFRAEFFSLPHPERTRKHLPDIDRGASAKRINMFLRWMVRTDNKGVDFGLWKEIPPSALYLPLDVHTGNVARKLGLLVRKQNDWQAVEELTGCLREFCPKDPVKYDFALFGLGIFEKF